MDPLSFGLDNDMICTGCGKDPYKSSTGCLCSPFDEKEWIAGKGSNKTKQNITTQNKIKTKQKQTKTKRTNQEEFFLRFSPSRFVWGSTKEG